MSRTGFFSAMRCTARTCSEGVIGLSTRTVIARARPKLIGAAARADGGERRAEVARGPVRARHGVAKEAVAVRAGENDLPAFCRIAGKGNHWQKEKNGGLHPRPTKGILVAMMVMNCTFDSSGRFAM